MNLNTNIYILVIIFLGFGSNLTKIFEDSSKDWAVGLKMHDHHKLLQWIYPIVIQGLGNERVQDAIMDLGKLLRYFLIQHIHSY